MKSMFLAVVMLFSAWLAGCNPVSVAEVGRDATREVVQGHNSNNGLVDGKAEREHRLGLINDIQARQLQDDWDYFWLYDRSSNLTRWQARAGQ